MITPIHFSHNQLPSVSPSTVNLTIRIKKSWIIDDSPNRKSTHQCTATVITASRDVDGIDPGKTVIRLRIRDSDFPYGVPALLDNQTIIISVKNIPAQKARGKGASAYYCLVPSLGMTARPQPAIVISMASGRHCDLMPISDLPAKEAKQQAIYVPPTLEDKQFRMPHGLSRGAQKRYKKQWRALHPKQKKQKELPN